MARIRTIKPEFFVSEQVADVSPTCRLLFIGMWLFCDDGGVHPASARQLKMEVFPGDDITAAQVQQMVSELLRVGLLSEYDCDEGTETKTYWHVTGWHHQKIEKPRLQYPKPESATSRRQVGDKSATPLPSRARAVPYRTVPETTVPEGNGKKESVRAAARFVVPTLEEVQQYSDEASLNLDASRFIDHYQAKGWMAGKVKMKDWKATARNASRDGWCRRVISQNESQSDRDMKEAFRLRDEKRKQREQEEACDEQR